MPHPIEGKALLQSFMKSVEEKRKKSICKSPLQPVGLIRRHTVPDLGSSIMEIVDPVEVHVLDVPGERGLPHSEIEIGTGLHSG